uniref:Uncharacterized protein n=1 Tax=Ditylenchus dipsaci TaxID=166011 RepID=A0A915E066_9BILA
MDGQEESLDQALEHLSDVEQDVVVLEEVVSASIKKPKLVPSQNYTGEVITLDDEDDEDRLARFLRFYSNSADSFNETFSDEEEDDEEEEEDEQDEKLENLDKPTKQEQEEETGCEKDDLNGHEQDFKSQLQETYDLKSTFAKYKKKAEKKENKLIDRLKFERKRIWNYRKSVLQLVQR